MPSGRPTSTNDGMDVPPQFSADAATGSKMLAPWYPVLVLSAIIFWIGARAYNLWGYRKGLYCEVKLASNYFIAAMILAIYLRTVWWVEHYIWRKRARPPGDDAVTLLLGVFAGLSAFFFLVMFLAG